MLDILALGAFASTMVVWVAYPAVMVLGSRLRIRPPSTSPAVRLRSVAVVIASRDPAEAIAARVDNCLDTALALPLEIIVAIDREGFEVKRAALERLAPRAHVVAADAEGGKAAGLNAGVRASTGDVLVFTDTYQRFDRSTIPALLAMLADASVGAVSGALVLPPQTPPLARAYWTYERRLRQAEAGVHSTVGVTGAVCAMRRSLWQPLPAGLLLDDVYIPMRIVLGGSRVAFTPAAFAFETRTPEPAQEYRRKVRTLTGVFQLCAWLPAVLLPWRNPIWFQFLFHKLLRLVTPYWLLVVGLWMVVAAGRILGPWVLVAIVALAVSAGWLWRTRSALGARLRTIASEAVLMQIAPVKAGWYGLRGRWRVWDG